MLDLLHRDMLQKREQKWLLEFARNCIVARINGRSLPESKPPFPRLNLKRGAFVTLTKNGNLRGCIGMIYPLKPLVTTVREAACAAAFDDPRFPPLQADELEQVKIEISVISPLKRVTSERKIKVQKHGLLLRYGDRNAVLLPQVAVRNKWDRKAFLEHVCLKAGLDKECWKDPDAELLIFEAQIFCED